MTFNSWLFPIPAQINTKQLIAELGCDDVYTVGDELCISGELTQEEAAAGLANHVPVFPPEPTVQEKLESVGLSIPDLKAALGL
jgi:hypothetical protein